MAIGKMLTSPDIEGRLGEDGEAEEQEGASE